MQFFPSWHNPFQYRRRKQAKRITSECCILWDFDGVTSVIDGDSELYFICNRDGTDGRMSDTPDFAREKQCTVISATYPLIYLVMAVTQQAGASHYDYSQRSLKQTNPNQQPLSDVYFSATRHMYAKAPDHVGREKNIFKNKEEHHAFIGELSMQETDSATLGKTELLAKYKQKMQGKKFIVVDDNKVDLPRADDLSAIGVHVDGEEIDPIKKNFFLPKILFSTMDLSDIFHHVRDIKLPLKDALDQPRTIDEHRTTLFELIIDYAVTEQVSARALQARLSSEPEISPDMWLKKLEQQICTEFRGRSHRETREKLLRHMLWQCLQGSDKEVFKIDMAKKLQQKFFPREALYDHFIEAYNQLTTPLAIRWDKYEESLHALLKNARVILDMDLYLRLVDDLTENYRCSRKDPPAINDFLRQHLQRVNGKEYEKSLVNFRVLHQNLDAKQNKYHGPQGQSDRNGEESVGRDFSHSDELKIKEKLITIKKYIEQENWTVRYGLGKKIVVDGREKIVPKHVEKIYVALSNIDTESINIQALLEKLEELVVRANATNLPCTNSRVNFFNKRDKKTQLFYNIFQDSLSSVKATVLKP